MGTMITAEILRMQYVQALMLVATLSSRPTTPLLSRSLAFCFLCQGKLWLFKETYSQSVQGFLGHPSPTD